MQIVIDGNNIHGIPSISVEINRVFMRSESWEIANSLDAFNDLLYGGFGIISGDQPVELIWINIAESRTCLGCDPTKAYYQDKLRPGSPYNHEMFIKKPAAVEEGARQTYFDIISEIIEEHPNITLMPA